MRIDALDHVVLTVRDVERTCEFYSRVLGMQVVEFQDGRKALHFGEQKFNLHQAGKEFEPKAARPMPGSVDLCLLTSVPLDEVTEHLRVNGVEIVEGPINKTGAAGALLSVYIRDPDGNLVEVSNVVNKSG